MHQTSAHQAYLLGTIECGFPKDYGVRGLLMENDENGPRTKLAPRRKWHQDENGPGCYLLYSNSADFKKHNNGCAQVLTQAETGI